MLQRTRTRCLQARRTVHVYISLACPSRHINISTCSHLINKYRHHYHKEFKPDQQRISSRTAQSISVNMVTPISFLDLVADYREKRKEARAQRESTSSTKNTNGKNGSPAASSSPGPSTKASAAQSTSKTASSDPATAGSR